MEMSCEVISQVFCAWICPKFSFQSAVLQLCMTKTMTCGSQLVLYVYVSFSCSSVCRLTHFYPISLSQNPLKDTAFRNICLQSIVSLPRTPPFFNAKSVLVRQQNKTLNFTSCVQRCVRVCVRVYCMCESSRCHFTYSSTELQPASSTELRNPALFSCGGCYHTHTLRDELGTI